MNVYQTTRVLTVIGLCGAILTACSGGAAKKESDGATASSAPTMNANEPANLVVYSNSGDAVESWDERFGNALKQKFPNYTIKYIPKADKIGIKELIAGGETIDIYWDSINGFASTIAENALQLDMTALMKKHNITLAGMEQTVADSVKQMSPDKVYGIPVFNNNMVLYYNKDLFDKFGVPYPKDGLTWKEATAMGEKLTRFDGGKQYAGLSSSQTHMLPMNQLSIPFVDTAKTAPTIFTNEKWRQYFDTVFVGPANAPGYKEYMKAHKDAIPYRNEFLKDKDLAMFAWLSSIVFVFPDDFKSMNWDVVSLPTFDSLPGVGSQAYPTYFTVTSMSKQQDQAMNVIQYLVSDEMQTKLSKLGVMPVAKSDAIKNVFGQDSMFKDKHLKAAFVNKFAAIPAKTKYDSTLLTPYAKTVPKIIYTGDYNTIFRATEEETAKKIAEMQ